MIVQHNMTALNANRQLGISVGNLAKSTEKLSSGYRINRAGDDAEMCARLFLHEIKDAGWCDLAEMNYCNGKL